MCVGKRKELITQKRGESTHWCSWSGMTLNSKHIVSCFKKVGSEIITRCDTVLNILLNNISIQRELVSHEQKWEDRKTVTTVARHRAKSTLR